MYKCIVVYCRRPVVNRVRHVKTPVSYTVVTSSAVNLAVLRVMSAWIHVAGRAHIISVDFRVISRVHAHHVIVLVTAFCCVDIAVLDSVGSRVSRCAQSAIARFVFYALSLLTHLKLSLEEKISSFSELRDVTCHMTSEHTLP